MDGKELLNQQLTIADDIEGIREAHEAGKEALAVTAAQAQELVPEVVDFSQVAFKVNVEQNAFDKIVSMLRKTKVDLRPEDVVQQLSDVKRRAQIFTAVYCSINRNVDSKKLIAKLPQVDRSCNYEEFCAQAESAMTDDHGFFTVTDEVVEESTEDKPDVADIERLQRYERRALEVGFPDDYVKRTVERCGASVKSYEDFEKILEEVINEDVNKERQEQKREELLQNAIRNDLKKLWADPNPVATLKSKILAEYNTEAVEVPEICYELEGAPELKLNIYKQPVFSIIHQINKPFVADAVNRCLAKWENNAVVEGIINSYLDSIGVPEDKREANRASLLEVLPERIKSQTAPDAWKHYKAVCIITQRELGDDEDITSRVFSDEEASIEFGARFENYVEEGVPIEAAQRQASEDYIHDMPEEEQISFVGKAGQFAGRAIRFKYESAATIEQMMRDSLGEYADDYFNHQAEVKARKAEIKKIKQDAKVELAKQKADMKIEHAKQKAEQHEEDKELRKMQRAEEKQLRRTNQGGFGNSRYNDPRFGANTGRGNYGGGFLGGCGNSYGGYGSRGGYGSYGRGGSNFAPHIPLPIIMTLVHVIVGLLSFIIFGGAKTAFLAVGLIIATFGFFRKQLNENNSIPMIVLGYAVSLLAVFIMFK